MTYHQTHNIAIRQIMPADGWEAVYLVDDDEEDKPYLDRIELIGWALQGHVRCCSVDNPNTEWEPTVVGLTSWDTGVESAEVMHNFVGYVKARQDVPPWMNDLVIQATADRLRREEAGG